ncbi:RNA-directed DNA polymerase (Reverse transcriptase), partial [Trifolium medium]|nr:RNA-directed DNA polymerase (Reverse transcriptase) [Trifolium medium]
AWDRMTVPKEFDGLGFRNLHLFNMAMVAKQGWKLMTQPETLVARIYKARYYPNSLFLIPILVVTRAMLGVAYGSHAKY